MKNILIYLYIVTSVNCFSQNSIINNIIANDFLLIEKTFNDVVFMQQFDEKSTLSYTIIDIDTTYFFLNKSNKKEIKSVNIFKIKLKLNEIVSIQEKSNYIKVNTDTLTYFILNDHNNYYKLFGFYVTDINLYFSNNGLDGLKELQKELVKIKALTNTESKLFKKSIVNQESNYLVNLNKPCNILKYYFNDKEKKLANTIILPIKPLLPLSVN